MVGLPFTTPQPTFPALYYRAFLWILSRLSPSAPVRAISVQQKVQHVAQADSLIYDLYGLFARVRPVHHGCHGKSVRFVFFYFFFFI